MARGSVPGGGTEIPQAALPGQNLKKKKKKKIHPDSKEIFSNTQKNLEGEKKSWWFA